MIQAPVKIVYGYDGTISIIDKEFHIIARNVEEEDADDIVTCINFTKSNYDRVYELSEQALLISKRTELAYKQSKLLHDCLERMVEESAV